MTVSEFDAGKQATFKAATAAVSGVSNADVTIVTVEEAADALNADVTIVKVESISGTRRGGGMFPASRHLLTAGIRVRFTVVVATEEQVDALVAKLTITSINTQLQQAGWSADAMFEAGSSTTSGGGGGGGIAAIIALSGLAFLLGIAFFFYRRFFSTETSATATCGLSSAELGLGSLAVPAPTRSLSAPALTLPVIGAHMGTSRASAKVCPEG